MPSPHVEYSLDGGVARIVLSRPEKRNALTPDMLDTMLSSLSDAGERGARVCILAGRGQAFCSGGDINLMMEALDGDVHSAFQDLTGRLYACVLALIRSPMVVVASIRGHVSGAGLGLALACDIRIASRSARFRGAYTSIGMSPNTGITYLLPRVVGPSLAADILLTGRVLDAEEALGAGLVTRLCEDDDLEDLTDRLAADISLAPPFTLRAAKRLLDPPLRDMTAHLDEEREVNLESVTRQDFREGVEAFLEKRRPVFTGK